MANIRKHIREKKKPLTSSVKSKHLDEFIDNCERLNLNRSEEIEKMIVNFNNSL